MNMNEKEISVQIKNAYGLLEKMFFEIANLIKEIEGNLIEQDEQFIIGRTTGYGMTTRGSAGLESSNIPNWLIRKIAVFFVPEAIATKSSGITTTPCKKDLKVIIVYFDLDHKDKGTPQIYFGILKNFEYKKKDYSKFEKFMWLFPERGETMFKELKGRYSDNYFAFDKHIIQSSLLEINNSKTVKSKIIDPILKLYRMK